METAIVSLICIALVVFGGMTMSQGFLSSVDTSTVGLEQVSKRDGEIMRTELSVLEARCNRYGFLTVTLRNSGQTKLADYSKWDFIVHYYDNNNEYYIKWLPYTTDATPADDEWTVERIYLDESAGRPEVYEPDILNPGEEILLEAQLNPYARRFSALMVVISTPNGTPASVSFICS